MYRFIHIDCIYIAFFYLYKPPLIQPFTHIHTPSVLELPCMAMACPLGATWGSASRSQTLDLVIKEGSAVPAEPQPTKYEQPWRNLSFRVNIQVC